MYLDLAHIKWYNIDNLKSAERVVVVCSEKN